MNWSGPMMTDSGGFQIFSLGAAYGKDMSKMIKSGEEELLLAKAAKDVDTFDCVASTRNARNATLYTKRGKINITNSAYTADFTPIDKNCDCYTCKHYTRSYVSHLFRSKEMLAATLSSIYNLYFIVNLVKNIR